MGYLKEILTGNYSNYNEDRLSQIFSASFNNSILFKRLFFSTARVKHKSLTNYSSQTQINYSLKEEEARIDIIIYYKDKPVLIIENKVDAPLTMNQIRKYSRISELSKCRKIAIVKHYFESFSRSYGWEILHWVDFYVLFKRKYERGISNKIDHYIISNFLEHLELMNMARVNKISKGDLINFSNAIHKIRTDGKPSISLVNKNVFETGTQLLSFMEEIIDLAHQDPKLVKSVGRNFRFSPRLEYWYLGEVSKNNNLMLVVSITLKKPIKNVKTLGTGFFFYNKTPNKYATITFANDSNGGDFIREKEYLKKEIVFDEYAKHVISTWKSWIK